MRRFASCLVLAPAVFLLSTTAWPQQRNSMIMRPVDESQLVTLEGNTPPAALHAENDRGAVADDMRFDHLLLALKGSPESEARLAQLIEDMHRPGSPVFHHWLTPQQLGARFGLAPHDLQAVRSWLESHGFSVNRVYQHGLVIDFAGTAGQIRESFHTEIHNLVLPSGERHRAIVRDPQIPAALAPAIAGVASLHDFFPRRRSRVLGPVSFDHAANRWQPHFNVTIQGFTFNTVSPFDLATIYNVLPLWSRGFTGKGVTIALVEDSNLAHPGDWSTFRSAFDLNQFKAGNFKQVYPNCGNPGANGDEFEAALDVEWASATAPDANIELSACPNTQTTSGLDLAILNLLDFSPPDIISDSYGLCETITGNAEVALENREAQIASALGTTFFIAQGDTGADECAPFEPTPFSILGINSGDNTASAYAVDVGGTDFMAQYNSDVNGIPISKYWNATNNPKTLASARSYIPEIPWNDGCTSTIILSDPLFGDNPKSYGPTGFCNNAVRPELHLCDRGQRRAQHLLYRQAAVSGRGQRKLQGQSQAVVSNRRAGHSAGWLARPTRSLPVLRQWRVGKLLCGLHVRQERGRDELFGTERCRVSRRRRHLICLARHGRDTGSDRPEKRQAGRCQFRLLPAGGAAIQAAGNYRLRCQSNDGRAARSRLHFQ